MTIFVVALFLPYTVNFNTTAVHAQHLRPPSPQVPRPQTAPGRRALSLLAYAPGKIVQTPGGTTDHEQIFTPSVPSKPFKLSLPAQVKEEKEQDDNNDRAATLNGLRDPRLLPRIDLHAPIWGSLTSLNQPVSRAKSPPPASILKHNATITSTGSLLWKHRYRARTASHERQFSESNYSIERAQHGNGGLFNAIDAVSTSGALKEKTWVGTLGMPTDALNDHLKESISERLEDDYEALTVYIDDGDFDGHYERYCKTILWPIFHYQIPDHPKSKAYEDHSWIYYVKVNQAFADRIIKNYKKGDIIWIHDYHLLLVPGMLRAKLPDAEIGFFMHTAFPSSEIFRCLATRTDLLEGLLGANMIGFQNVSVSSCLTGTERHGGH
jgi:trehalose 6-phosphate synthase complex regulatory subunit